MITFVLLSQFLGYLGNRVPGVKKIIIVIIYYYIAYQQRENSKVTVTK